MIRLTSWPECLAEKAISEAVKEAEFEGYEQKSGQRVGIYRVR